MKRIGCILGVFGSIILFMVLSVLFVSLKSEHTFQDEIYVYPENMPEGTYYTDVLAPISESDPLWSADTGVRPDGADITENSEIFTYHTDGYVSISLHYSYAESIGKPEQGDAYTEIRFAGNTKDGRGSVGKELLWLPGFRIAYVSREGKVLGVTNPAAANPHMTPFMGIPFTTNGNTAEYQYTSGTTIHTDAILLIVEILLLPVFALLSLPFILLIKKDRAEREKAQMIADIQRRAAEDAEREKKDA